ncbi:MAG TPA: hypothetical protein VF227_13900 [Actinomycetes bacterium]
MTVVAPKNAPNRAGLVESPSSPLFRLGVIGVAGIWLAVLVISIFSPDMVTGSEQEHVPIAAILTWIWGLIATRSLVTALAAQRDRPENVADLRWLVGGILAVWLVAAVVSVFAPVNVTGADPTKMPVGAILAPIAAMVLTTTACQLFATLRDGSKAKAIEAPR